MLQKTSNVCEPVVFETLLAIIFFSSLISPELFWKSLTKCQCILQLDTVLYVNGIVMFCFCCD